LNVAILVAFFCSNFNLKAETKALGVCAETEKLCVVFPDEPSLLFSSAIYVRVCVYGTALPPLSSSYDRCWPRSAAAVGAVELEGAHTMGGRRFAPAHGGSGGRSVR
jgi:hypothetical protein